MNNDLLHQTLDLQLKEIVYYCAKIDQFLLVFRGWCDWGENCAGLINQASFKKALKEGSLVELGEL